MRDGVPGLQIGEQMGGLARELIPLASPIMDHVHQRLLQHFVEQDVIGHMEMDLADARRDLGHMRVAIAFADLAGYTRLTEEEGSAIARVEQDAETATVAGLVRRFADLLRGCCTGSKAPCSSIITIEGWSAP